MLAISDELIRQSRTASYQLEEADSPHKAPTEVEKLLSSSPPLPGLMDSVNPRDSVVKHTGEPVKVKRRHQKQFSKDDGSLPSRPAAPSFAKVPVVKPKRAASSLSKELESGRLHASLHANPFHGQSRSGHGSLMRLDVFVKTGDPPMKLKVPASSTVEEVIELIVRQYTYEKRKPPLMPDPDVYDLRMVDEDDGSPDTDIPPLERSGVVKNFGVDAVALCPRDGYVPSQETPEKGTRKKRGISLGLNIKRGRKHGELFLKIHMPNQISHTLSVKVDMKVLDLLPLVSKKRSSEEESLSPNVYKFCYVGEDEAIEMDTVLRDILSDELALVRRVPKETEMEHLSTDVDDFAVSFNHVRAHEYSEYEVVKTNARGIRQKRVLGIDGKKIYNRNPDALNILGRKISMDVRRANRLISDVIDIEALADRRSFRIRFHDKTGDIETRNYEADTKMECSQIVAKINFLLDERKTGTS